MSVPPARETPSLRRSSLWCLAIALCVLPWADLSVTVHDPWTELARMASGMVTPQPGALGEFIHAIVLTLAFAFQGVALGALGGFVLALGYRRAAIRRTAAVMRSIHEVFWALIFLQWTGLSTVTGVLALAIPYAGTFAKIYGELFEETDASPRDALLPGVTGLQRMVYTVLPQAWRSMAIYTGYRLECGIRSSAVLGFIGLPTVGYHLETALKQGNYSEAAALFYALVIVIVSLRMWLRRSLVPVYLVAACIVLPPVAEFQWAPVLRFFTEDIVPAPIRQGLGIDGVATWLLHLMQTQMLPGLFNTAVLAILALVGTGFFTLLAFPGISRLFGHPASRAAVNVGLVMMRSAPEFLLASIGVLLWGPGMLPALVALSTHNGAILAHLVGRVSDGIRLREDAPTGLYRYFYEVLPRIYRQFMAFTLYRFEILLRETAILGVLGVPTLGFYIDSAFAELRADRAMVLLAVTAGLNMAVDAWARRIRQRLHLVTQPESL